MVHALKPVLVTGPGEMPVSLVEAKAHLRVDADNEDTVLSGYLAAAVSYLDGWSGILGRCLVSQEWRQDFSGFPASGHLRLPFPNVSAVVVKYTDPAEAEQTFAGANYSLVEDAESSAIVLNAAASWPDVASGITNVSVSMTCGYGAPAAVPQALRSAILIHVAALDARRDGGSLLNNDAYWSLVAPFRRMRV